MNAAVAQLLPERLHQLHGSLNYLLSDSLDIKSLYLATALTPQPFDAPRVPIPRSKLGPRPYSLNLPII